jgi:hypothetical protein
MPLLPTGLEVARREGVADRLPGKLTVGQGK